MRYLIIVIILGLGAAAYLYFTPKPLGQGEEMPVFSLETVHGRPFDIEKYYGKTICLIFFSMEDEAARRMFSDFHFLTDQLKGNPNVKYVAVAVDGTPSRAKLFISQYKFPGDVLFDSDKTVTKSFRLTSFPFIYIVDSEGLISYSIGGWERDHIRELLPAIKRAGED